MSAAVDVAASGEVPAEVEESPDRPVGLSRRLAAWCQRHPLLLVAITSGAIALAQAIWIWKVRHLGGFDPDESSYLASALRMQRTIDLRHPGAFPIAVATTGHGITVPLLSVPLLLLGPRDPRTALMVQPLLMVFIAVATAGTTLRITRRAAPAVIAGTWVVLLPTMITATQSYWYGLGAAAAMAGAAWALVSSERATNRWIWWYGVGIGLMCLTRTMTLGYLPAMGVAGVVVAWPERRAIGRVVAAFCLGLAIAAPWYLINLRSIFDYLFTFGYGDRAAEWGATGFTDRLQLRWDRMAGGIGLGWFLPVALVAVLYVLVALVRRRALPRLDGRPFLAVVTIIVLGTAALLSTSNNGVWFELPLVVLTIVALVAAGAQLPKPVGGLCAAGILVGTAAALPGALWLVPWAKDRPVSHYEWGFAQYDERFHPDTRPEHAQAAAEWWALSTDVEREMRRISPDGRSAKFVMTGNTLLYNANVVQMAAEMDPWGPDIVVPNTMLAPRDRATYLGRHGDVRRGLPERVIVIGLHDQIMWPLDMKARAFLAQAEADGFVETKRFEMPRGGHVSIYRRATDP